MSTGAQNMSSTNFIYSVFFQHDRPLQFAQDSKNVLDDYSRLAFPLRVCKRDHRTVYRPDLRAGGGQCLSLIQTNGRRRREEREGASQALNIDALAQGTNLRSSHYADNDEDKSFLFKGIREAR